MSRAGCAVTFFNWHNLAVICITARKVMVIALPHLGEYGIFNEYGDGPKTFFGAVWILPMGVKHVKSKQHSFRLPKRSVNIPHFIHPFMAVAQSPQAEPCNAEPLGKLCSTSGSNSLCIVHCG